MDPLPPPQQQGYIDPLLTNVGYMPQSNIHQEAMMTKHLDASDMLSKLKHMLLGYEYNEEEDQWKPSFSFFGYDGEGNKIMRESEPIMPERTIRSIIGSLEIYLSPNTFLSNIGDEGKNDIMFGVCQNLAIIWFRLGHRIRSEERAVIHSTIKDAIFLGLSRAGNKITLDAISKMQQSHEIIQTAPSTPTEQQKEFKILGW